MTTQQLAAELANCSAVATRSGFYVQYQGRWADLDELRKLIREPSARNT